MLICIDLSAMYFAIRDLNITINYEKFLTELRSRFGEDAAIECFTIAKSTNVSQQKFLQKLETLGVNLHVYPSNTSPNFSNEICSWVGISKASDVLIISNDTGLIRPFQMFKQSGRNLTLSFFSEKLQGFWTPRILSGEVQFSDLSSDSIREKIAD